VGEFSKGIGNSPHSIPSHSLIFSENGAIN
jgi:hypothetical protein